MRARRLWLVVYKPIIVSTYKRFVFTIRVFIYTRPRRVALRVIILEYLYKSLWQLSRPVLI